MGLADMLIQLGVKYGSLESIKLIETIYKTIAKTAIEESLALAKELGCYPKCDKEKLVESSFIKKLDLPLVLIDDIRKYGLYNSQLLTCAPTGSIGTMFETSTGIEPYFALSYTRKTQSLNGEDTYYQVDSKIVKDYKNITGNNDIPEYFVTSENIDPLDRVRVQAALQEYTDASISSTVNLPNKASVEDVYRIYTEAWKKGLKGITIYRSGCKREGILTTEKPEEKTESNELPRGFVVKAEDNCIGLKRTLTTGCGTLHCTAYFDPNTGDLLETYLSKGSKGGCQNFMIGLSRMISLSARGGISIDNIIDQLNSCGVCPSYAVRKATKNDTSLGSCCPTAVGIALKDMQKEVLSKIQMNKIPTFLSKDKWLEFKRSGIAIIDTTEYDICPECGQKGLTHSGGCDQCILCGYSKCN